MRFILVDEIIELVPGKNIRASKTMDRNEELFLDHFPGFPVVPGVLLTEMMAQASGKCLEAEDTKRGKPILAQVRNASFRKWVRPGEKAVISCTVKISKTTHAVTSCFIEVKQSKVAQAELFFSFMDFKQFSPDYLDTVQEGFLRDN